MRNGRIKLEPIGDVLVMTLNDPSVLNAFGQKLREDMSEALDRIEADRPRCLVITGAGRAFCSGANLNDPDRPARDRAAELRGEFADLGGGFVDPVLAGEPVELVVDPPAQPGDVACRGLEIAHVGDAGSDTREGAGNG